MKVEIYVGLGSQRKRIWKGELDTPPRIGEEVVLGQDGYTVERIHHLLAKNLVEIYVR